MNPAIMYGGNNGGFLSRVNHDNGQERVINVWPVNSMGRWAEGMKYRFQWDFPIPVSRTINDPKKLYITSNHMYVTFNEGQEVPAITN